jgi:flagellar motor switch protein FliM
LCFLCLIILGVPGDALLLRVAWMERHDFRTKRTDDLVSLANSSVVNLLISGLLSLVNNAHNEFAGGKGRCKNASEGHELSRIEHLIAEQRCNM